MQLNDILIVHSATKLTILRQIGSKGGNKWLNPNFLVNLLFSIYIYSEAYMSINQRIDAFVRLGEEIRRAMAMPASTFASQLLLAEKENPWFTQPNIVRMLNVIAGQWLTRESLEAWAYGYVKPDTVDTKPMRVGVVAAGNIPLVGFHDVLCVLLAGHTLVLKPSSRDTVLMRALRSILIASDPDVVGRCEITDGPLRNIEAIIATGGNGAAMHFQRYIERYPSILRQHRNSMAILDGTETPVEIECLADDVFAYFGMGCRSVSTVWVPEDFDLVPMLDRFGAWRHITQHHKYANNYEYQRTLFAINGIHHYDTGYLLLRESDALDSPIGVLHYRHYTSPDEVRRFMADRANELQCVVGNPSKYSNAIPFGTAQTPSLSDYADGIDTFNFLLGLQKKAVHDL